MEMTTTLDFRSLQRNFREALVFSVFESLETGSSLTLIHDRDFVDLKLQLESVALANIEWTYLQSGPTLWKLVIKKTAEKTPHPGCCGVGGGGENMSKPTT